MDILEGIQVVDLSHGTAGPVVGMFLADFGAEVIKAEPPGGDPARSPGTGEHSWEALRAAGLADAEIEALRGAGTVIAGDPMPQALPNAYR